MVAPNPLRKQTLLGMAPVLPERPATPPAVEEPLAPIADPPPPPPVAEVAPERVQLTVPAANENPLRKQTLLGIAPVLPPAPAPVKAAPAPLESEAPSVVTPAAAAAPVVTTDAPTTLEVERPAPSEPVVKWPPPTRDSLDDEDLPQLKPKRAGWIAPLGVAAAIAIAAVVALKLGRSSPAPEPTRPITAAQPAPPEIAPAPAKPKSDDDSGDHGNDNPSTGDASAPDPRAPEPSPLAAAASAAPSASEAPSVATSPEAAASADKVRINVVSDPPGARLFWKGKSVGTTPFVLELAPGEKHAYEMGMPGYNTRKVVIDGTKTEISVGLKPQAGAFIGQTRGKP